MARKPLRATPTMGIAIPLDEALRNGDDNFIELYASGGGGGGAVASVNGETGVVVLNAADVGAATTADISAAVAALVDSSQGTLDTLNELAAALGDDANFASTITSALALKAPSTNIALTSLATIAAGTFLGNNTGGASVPLALTAAQVKTVLAIASGDVSGLAASATTDTTNASNISSGTLAVARGGSGANTLIGLLQGNGTGAFTGITNSSSVGDVLTVTGASTYAFAPPSGGGGSGANPTASVGLAAVNGVATTFLRSDGAPALDASIAPTMTGAWAFSNSITAALAGSLAAPSLLVANSAPVIGIFDTDAGAGVGKFVIDGRAASELRISAINDTGSGSAIGLSITRTATPAVSNVTVGSGTSTFTHNGSGAFTSLGVVTGNVGIAARKGSVTISTTERVRVGGVSYTNFATIGNTAATETDAFSHSITANTLGTDGESLRFEAAGTFAATASVDKRVKVVYGATTLFDTGALAVTGGADWRIQGTILRTGAATQKAVVQFTSSFASLNSSADYTAPTETLSGAVTLKLTVNGTNANDTVGQFYKEEWHPFL